MPAHQPNVDDVTTTNTLEVWRDKLAREDRAKREWHYRWGRTFGQPSRPATQDTVWRPMAHIPELPPPGHGPQLVEPTASALRWDAAFNRSMVPLRAPSVTTYGSRMSGQLPSMRAASISSSADRRRELLLERQHELTAQLNLVEQMLKQAAPSTCMSTATGVSATSGVTAYSDAPPGAYPVPPPSAPSEAGSVATSVRSRMTDGSASARGRRSGGTPRSERGMTPRSERGATPRTGTPRAGTPREAGTPRLAPTPEMAAVA